MRLPNPLTAGRTARSSAHSAELREQSRASGALLFTPVYDVDCEDCDRPFVPHHPGVLRCRRCRKESTA